MHIWLITNNYEIEKAFIGSENEALDLMDTLRYASYAIHTRDYGWVDYDDYCSSHVWRIRRVEAYSG